MSGEIQYSEIIDRWQRLFNTQDPEQFWKQCYTQDCVVEFVLQGEQYIGTQAMIEMEEELYKNLPGYSIEVTEVVAADNKMSIEYKFILGDEVTEGTSFFTLNSQGLIERDRTYTKTPSWYGGDMQAAS